MENEIAIVGSGISGLSCAHRLSRNGFKVRVFEKDAIAGGRAPKAIRIISKEDTSILTLLNELDYTNIENATLDKFASYVSGKATTFTKFKPLFFRETDLSFSEKIMRRMASIFTHTDLRELRELQKYIDSLEFSFENNNAEVEKLHNISTEEWLNNYSENLRNLMLIPMLQITFEPNLSKQTAKYGVRQIREFFRIGWNGGYIIKGGPYAITKEIIKSIRNKGNDIEFLSEVKKVEETSNGFEVIYEKYEIPDEDKTEEIEKFKYVVLSTPLTSTSKILGEDFKIPYISTRSIYLRGDLKEKWEVVIGPDHESNFRSLYTVVQGEYYVHPVKPERDVTNLNGLFKKGELKTIDIEEVPIALPRILPCSRIPSLEYNPDGIYICGDFYHYPSVDTSAATGFMVANEIMAKKG
ncbi:MAG TPA: FAD-dependent oxidoreductase [Candidatus Altiarchaeales archaeon]|nr:FAD-dependent oxidoreductase [Candidatus Altiarchaeales archaeon]